VYELTPFMLFAWFMLCLPIKKVCYRGDCKD
jgi:hypothetical protein